MDAMIFKGRLLLLGGTNSERRRARLTKKGQLTFRDRDFTGIKAIDVDFSDGSTRRTPHGVKVVAQRRRRNKIARQSRKGNR